MLPLNVKSVVDCNVWPGLPGPAGEALLAVHYQLEQSQWLPPEELLQLQFRQLAGVCTHAYKQIPFYRKRFDEAGVDPARLTPETFPSIPLLTRRDIQTDFGTLTSRQMPRGHGKAYPQNTSGSTGMPIRTVGTDITRFFWKAFTLRDHLWHRRDFRGTLASIRTDVKDGAAKGWGPSTEVIFATGPCVTLNIRADIDAQVAWLEEKNPDYLLSHPSNIAAVAERCGVLGVSLKNLLEVRTFGELVTPELRAACRRVWNVPVTDMYSATEIGYIALQCPGHEHYHVQSENVLVEVINDQGAPCGPGEIGRLVITTLHNFAMPLIRYEILDYAEVGEPCPCGRGLPVLRRILGRQRNLVTLPDGTRHWPSFRADNWSHITPIRQVQLVQKDLQNILVRLVADRVLSKNEEKDFAAVLQKHIGYPFVITLQYLERIERTKNFKYEDFVSEVKI